ncbi:MAG: hypothetical protein ABI182_08625 [Candidatus Baltobacteraceae bacterium]
MVVVAVLVTTTTFGANSAPAPGSTTFSDLSHLEYEATGELAAHFVSPLEGAAAPVDEVMIVVSTVKGAGIELQINGNVVGPEHLGKRTINDKTGETQYYFYGVPLLAGENTVGAIPIGANGTRGPMVSEHLYGPGDPATIRVDFAANPTADGVTAVPLDVQVVDRFGHPAEPGGRLRVAIVRGEAHFQSAGTADELPQPGSTASPTPQPDTTNALTSEAQPQIYRTPLQPGAYQRIMVVPGLVPGPLDLDITAGDVTLHRSFYIAPHLRAPFVNGVASAGIGTVPVGDDGNGNYDNGGARRGRAALYASGKVGKKSLLTIVYESQNQLEPLSSVGAAYQDPNERTYHTYGDTSQLSDTLHSNDHLYARLDSGPNSLMWGQFNAVVGPNDVGGYQQLVSGADAHLSLGRSANTSLTAFSARNPVGYGSVVFPVSGLASLEQPLNPDIVVGSDIVMLVTLDRRSGLILSQVPLIRNVDYTLDYATGVLRFINIPLPYDPNFNPNVVQIRYEYQGAGVRSLTTGGDFKTALSRDAHTNLELGYVNDVSGTGNFGLFTQSVGRSWNAGAWSLTHARSNGLVPSASNTNPTSSGGDAYAFLLHARSASNALDLSAQSTSIGYADPFGGLSTPGVLAYRAAWTKTFSRTSQFALEADGESNAGLGNAGSSSQRNASATYSWKPSQRFSLLAGLVQHAQTITSTILGAAPLATPSPAPVPSTSPLPTPPPLGNTNQLQAQLGVQYRATKRVALSAQEDLTLSGSDVGSTQPSQTQAEVDYDLAGKGKLFARGLWSSQAASSFANATGALTYGTASTQSLQFGIQRDLTPAMSVSTDYVVDGTGNATNIYDALGVNEKLRLNRDLGANLFIQTAQGKGSGAQGFSVWGGNLGFANAHSLHATLAYQTRSGNSGGSTANAGIAGSLTPDLSIIGTIQRSYSQASLAVDDNVSMAYRSLANDHFESLLGYTRTTGNSGVDTSVANVISFEELFRPIEGFDVASRIAYKLDGGGGYTARTMLVSVRARQQIAKMLDVAAEVRHVSVPSIANADATDFSTEVGYQVGNSARVAVGYTFSGSVDPTLVGHPQRKGFYLTVTSLVNRIFGWGKQQ